MTLGFSFHSGHKYCTVYPVPVIKSYILHDQKLLFALQMSIFKSSYFQIHVDSWLLYKLTDFIPWIGLPSYRCTVARLRFSWLKLTGVS